MWMAVGLAALGISSIASAALLTIVIEGEASVSAFGFAVVLTAPGLLATGWLLGLVASLLFAGLNRAAGISRERSRREERMSSAVDLAGLEGRRRLLTDQIALLERKLDETELRVDSSSAAGPVTKTQRREKRPFPRMPEEPIVVLDHDGHL